MKRNAAPSPDNLLAMLYRRFWNIVKKNVMVIYCLNEKATLGISIRLSSTLFLRLITPTNCSMYCVV